MTADAARAIGVGTHGAALPLSSLLETPWAWPRPAVADPAPTGDPFPWAWVAALVSRNASRGLPAHAAALPLRSLRTRPMMAELKRQIYRSTQC